MNVRDIEVELIDIFYMWTEVYSPQNLDIEETPFISSTFEDKGDATMQISNNFDYEILPNKEWHFYHYLGMRLPHLARVVIRLNYQMKGEDPAWSTLFTFENIQELVLLSIEHTVLSFKDFCKTNSVDLIPTFKIDAEELEEMKVVLSKGMVETYNTNRKYHDLNCFEAENTIALHCPQSAHVNITLHCSFMIIDEILYNNLAFKRSYNRSVFYNYVPECRYYTLKMKCIQIAQHPVALSSLDVQLFLVLLDCSLQILLGDKADFLIAVLEERGVSSNHRKMYFKSATELFSIFHDSAIAPAQTDWNSIIQ